MEEKYKNNFKYFENRDCKYYPCHKAEHINCLFCYCPLYLKDDCPGTYTWITKKMERRLNPAWTVCGRTRQKIMKKP